MSSPVDIPLEPEDAGDGALDGAVRRRRLRDRLGPTGSNLLEWAVVVVSAIGLAFLVKVFLLQAFYIPSLSMYPELDVGDRVLVNKLSYRLGDVGRGDIIVFERPESESRSEIPDLIKRVIGLPDDRIVIADGLVEVNGIPLVEEYLAEGAVTSAETAPNKCRRDDPCVVPPGMVWVMGDNRPDSKDSRYFGPIAEDSIVGRAFARVWPLDRIGLL